MTPPDRRIERSSLPRGEEGRPLHGGRPLARGRGASMRPGYRADMKAVIAVVRGYVQGVGFRYWTRRRALAAGVQGWVRNLHDGSVEVLAQGEETEINELLATLEEGPPGARVTNISVTEAEPDPTRRGFEVRG